MEDKENLSDYQSAYRPQFKFYDENQWYLTRYVDRIERYVKERSPESMVSLGIGHQVVSSRLLGLLQSGDLQSYTVIEGSEDIIAEFRQQAPEVEGLELVHAYFEEFDTERRFDAIEMGFVLEHVDDPGLVVERFRRLLSDNGRMFVAVPNARSLHRLIGHYAGLLDDVYQLSEHDLQLGHKRYFDLESITELVERNGMEVVRQQGLMLNPITADQMNTLEWGPDIIDALMVLGDNHAEVANCLLIEAVSK